MQVIMEVTERQIVPGETARFPFTAPSGEGLPPILEFHIISDNPNFNPGWAHVIRSTDDTHSPRYILEIRPTDIRHSRYGTYPLCIYSGNSWLIPVWRRPVHAHHKTMCPAYRKTHIQNLARRNALPVAGELRRRKHRRIGYYKPSRLELVDRVGVRAQNGGRAVRIL